MAQYVDYWADNIEYKEGPFVLCGGPIGANSRLEVERKGHFTCVCPDPSLYPIMRTFQSLSKEELCDQMNDFVRMGEIVLKGDMWVAKDPII